jgi:FtsP/CotA-like multicopper oxidase with cupredoxin domain
MLPLFLLVTSPLVAVSAHAPEFPWTALPVIEANDNRQPAGTRSGNVLTLQLEARTGLWYPEGPAGRGLEVAAFGEPGKPLQNPGPMIRVPAGTEVRIDLRNSLDRPLTVFGLGKTRGKTDSLMVNAGGSSAATFLASSPGIYYYYARSAPGPFGGRQEKDAELNGVIVVDAPGAAPRYPDRVFLISWWFTLDSTSKTGLGRATMAMNGLSWPHTERIDLVQGDSTRWHVINLTEVDHPMHLHGFYFQMEAKGDGVRDTVYARHAQRLAVTEIIAPGQTMTLAWSPTRPGNWIYHCHFIGHVSHHAALDTDRGTLDEAALAHHQTDRPHQMYGLVLGIRVAPKGSAVAETRAPKPIRLLVREKERVYGEHTGFAYVLGGSKAEADPATLPPPPGPTLVLERGAPVMVTIVNQSKERAAVHWHGIELESYPDGVPDWSGQGTEILPSVRPGDSITVRFTPPRAGTFMYHSHFNEEQQISSGLYAPLLVVEPGQRFDPETDRVLMFSSGGPTVNVISGPFSPTVLNGKVQPEPMEFKAGTTYRLRLLNMTGDVNTIVALLDGQTPVEWRLVAKDGATVPDHQATTRPATLFFDPGEIYDFEFTPKAPGKLILRFGPPDAPPEFGLPKKVDVAVVVR